MNRIELKRARGRKAALAYLAGGKTLAQVARTHRTTPTVVHYHVAILRRELSGESAGTWPEDEVTL